jgi:hypothetical protein
LTRVKEAGPASFFTRVLDAPDEPDSFFGRRSRVLGAADGGDPMTMPPAREVLGVDEDECEDDDAGSSILRGSQCRCGIVSREWLPAAMWSRTRRGCGP